MPLTPLVKEDLKCLDEDCIGILLEKGDDLPSVGDGVSCDECGMECEIMSVEPLTVEEIELDENTDSDEDYEDEDLDEDENEEDDLIETEEEKE